MGDVIRIDPRKMDTRGKKPDTVTYGGGTGGGDGMIEVRVAKLESDVENIKTNLSEARADIRDLKSLISDIRKDTSVLLQVSVEIKDSLSKKASKDELEAKINAASNKQILWSVGSLITIITLATTIVIKMLAH